MDRSGPAELESTWFDAHRAPERSPLASLQSLEGMFVDRRTKRVAASPDRLFGIVERVGGASGWPYANLLWRLRGLADRTVGGVGMRLGRRDPDRLRVGDALDFWRVEAIRRPGLLRLRAEMKVPGRAWLQYDVRARWCRQPAAPDPYFEPKDLPGTCLLVSAVSRTRRDLPRHAPRSCPAGCDGLNPTDGSGPESAGPDLPREKRFRDQAEQHVPASPYGGEGEEEGWGGRRGVGGWEGGGEEGGRRGGGAVTGVVHVIDHVILPK